MLTSLNDDYAGSVGTQMNLLKIQLLGKGMHPREVVVGVATREGEEQLTVFDNEIHNKHFVRIGFPVEMSNGHLLVELPGETVRGHWRVWVSREDVSEAS